MNTNSIVSLQRVGLTLPGVERPILENISLQVNEGDFMILLGGNGSGKSSLINLINGRYSANEGIVNFSPNCQPKQSIITLTQNMKDALFLELTVLENCILRKTNFVTSFFKRISNTERTFFKDYLSDFNKDLVFKLDTKVKHLSGGQKQALLLAMCVLNKPKLLLLDEHTSALDPKSSDKIIQLTQQVVLKNNITCIMTTHNLDYALSVGNSLVSLKEGGIFYSVAGKIKENLCRTQLLELCY